MDWDAILQNPLVIAAAVGALGTVGLGLKKVWTALIAATVRRLEQVAPDHDGDDAELVQKVRAQNDDSTVMHRVEAGLMKTMPATFIIDQAKLRNSKIASDRPAKGDA